MSDSPINTESFQCFCKTQKTPLRSSSRLSRLRQVEATHYNLILKDSRRVLWELQFSL